MKRILIAVAAAAALLAAPAWAQMGPGMMGGYGTGPGMTGPGMMGGYGPGGYGPGGYGMGPGMMGGYGPGGYGPGGYGMGPGMMGGYGGYGGLNLTDEQRAKIDAIQQEASRKQWDLMGKTHEQMSALMLDARKRVDAVLTKEQREQLSRGWRGR